MRPTHLLVLMICGLCLTVLSAEVKIQEQVVGPAPDAALPSYTISERGVHYAILTMKGSRSLVVVDGQEGPLFDELLSTTGERSLTAQNAVIFSHDGEHYAYLARTGNEYILVKDGKEVFRAPYWISALRYGKLAFSPMGKHLHFVAAEQRASLGAVWRVVMDGKPGPEILQALPPVFSPNDSRWAYQARKIGSRDDEWLVVVDGKEGPKDMLRPVFTGDGRLITTSAATADTPPQLWVDGKVAIKSPAIAEKVWVAKTGSRYAAAAQVKAGGPLTLFIDGKAVEGATDPQNVVFSPDGKRYLAACRAAAGQAFVVTDGKLSQQYQGVTGLTFTPDSTKALYQAYSGSKSFLVVEGAESAGFGLLAGQVRPVTLSEQGARIAYGTLDGMNQNFSAVVDGNNVLPKGRRAVGDSFVFSPDGKRYAFTTLPAARNDDRSLVIDGVEVPGVEPQLFSRLESEAMPYVTFSPNSQHAIWRGMDKANRARAGLVVNGQLVPAFFGYTIRQPVFTPDSQHVLWMTREFSPTQRPAYHLYVDGRKVGVYEESFEMIPAAWGMGADGVLQFLARAGDVVKRFRVTPGSETSLATLISDAQAAEAEALAAAASAKAKAEADKAKAQTDAAAAQAKQKADADAALLAKTKAREDALAAKTKAREDALAAKQKAREEALAKKKSQ